MRKILIDQFFHMPPGHRLSRNIAVGGYITNFGRYSPFDLYHPNGASMLLSDLVAKYDVEYLNQPYSEVSLCGADILVIPNPDYPLYEGASPYRIDHDDVDALFAFLERGGCVLMLVNSFLSKSDFWEENFDYERVNPIFQRLGLTWDENFMSDDNRILPAESGKYIVGYGQGGRAKGAKLPAEAKPLLTFEGDVFGFTKEVGKGKIAVIGDAGLISNGLYGFPTFQNKAFLEELMDSLQPGFDELPDTFEKVTYGNVSTAPSPEGIHEALFRSLREDARYRVDHHYRHLLWETAGEKVSAAQAESELPFTLADLQGKTVEIKLKPIPVNEGRATKELTMTLNVASTQKGEVTEYLVTGNQINEGLTWEDAGADPEVFGKLGELLRVNTVVQIQLAVQQGKLKYAAVKQGQILYDHNLRNVHYGFDILLASSCAVYSPSAK